MTNKRNLDTEKTIIDSSECCIQSYLMKVARKLSEQIHKQQIATVLKGKLGGGKNCVI